MAKKIKVELTEKQYFAVTMTLCNHCFDIADDTTASVEHRVISNAVNAMDKGYDKWKK